MDKLPLLRLYLPGLLFPQRQPLAFPRIPQHTLLNRDVLRSVVAEIRSAARLRFDLYLTRDHAAARWLNSAAR